MTRSAVPGDRDAASDRSPQVGTRCAARASDQRLGVGRCVAAPRDLVAVVRLSIGSWLLASIR